MPSEPAKLRCLLDEHYPGWLAEALESEGIDAPALTAHWPQLRGADDELVLRSAVADGRVVVTEDVRTFSDAISLVGHHLGVVYCHHARFPSNQSCGGWPADLARESVAVAGNHRGRRAVVYAPGAGAHDC